MTRRQVQVADSIQQYMSHLLQRELKDPRIGFTTVTSVNVSQDLRYARIYVSVMGTPEEQKSTMDALTSGKGFIRRELGARLAMRFVPEIQFRLDTSAEYSANISRILNELKLEESSREAGEVPQVSAVVADPDTHAGLPEVNPSVPSEETTQVQQEEQV